MRSRRPLAKHIEMLEKKVPCEPITSPHGLSTEPYPVVAAIKSQHNMNVNLEITRFLHNKNSNPTFSMASRIL